MTLSGFLQDWNTRDSVKPKKSIQTVANKLLHSPVVNGKKVLLGDDAAAIPVDDGYLLLAAEGVWPPLLKHNPRMAGRVSVLTNVSDIYAMGGRPLAVVDVLIANDAVQAGEILEGMRENSERYSVPIVGGHYTPSEDASSLAVCILGKAKKLLTSYHALPGDELMLVGSPKGKLHPTFDFWDCSSGLTPEELLGNLNLLPLIAEAEWCDTAKDVSMAGIIGTALMLLETSGCGAEISLDRLPCPPGTDFLRWLRAFPSYGFILSVRPENGERVRKVFEQRGLSCAPFARVLREPIVTVTCGHDRAELWKLSTPVTGFGIPFNRGET